MKNLYIFFIFFSISCFAQQEKSLKLYNIVDYTGTLIWGNDPFQSQAGYKLIDSSFALSVPANEIWIISQAQIDINGSTYGFTSNSTTFDFDGVGCPGFCIDNFQLLNWANKYVFDISNENGTGFVPNGSSPSSSINGAKSISLHYEGRRTLLPGSHSISNGYHSYDFEPTIKYRIVIEKYKFNYD